MTRIHKTIIGFSAFLTLGLFIVAAPANAGAFVGSSDLYGGQEANINANIGMTTVAPQVIIARLINITLGFLGIIFLGLVVYGGFLWMTSAGDPTKIEKSKKLLMAAVIGLVLVLSSWAIARYIINKLNGAIGPGSGSCTIGQVSPCACGTKTCDATGNWDLAGCTPCGCVGPGCLGSSCDGNTLTPFDPTNAIATCEPGGICNPGLTCDQGTATSSCTCIVASNLGEPCNGTTTPAMCIPAQNKCNSLLVCAPAGGPDECTCIGAPVIDWISPKNAAGNPVGTSTNFMTIGGRYFGTTTGQVRFFDGATTSIVAQFPSTVNAACGGTWSEDQIIVIIPPGAQDGPIQVVRADTQEDTTNNGRGNAIPDFQNDNLIRPGLCSSKNTTVGSTCIGLSCGYFNENFNLQGIHFNGAARTILLGGTTGSTSASGIVWGGTNLFADASIPDLIPAKTRVFLKVDGRYSNEMNFEVFQDNSRRPRIDYIDPGTGHRSDYATIYGSNFGAKPGQVTFNPGAFPADVSFPVGCENYWHDTYIIVKVSPTAQIGPNQVTVTTAAPAQTSDPADFTVIAGTPGPGICSIKPRNGEVGQEVNVIGERFGAWGGSAATEFFDVVQSTTTASANWNPGNNGKIKTDVPTGAETGPFKVINSAGTKSNSLNFMVGKCTQDSQCDVPGGETCCVSGTKDGLCDTDCGSVGASSNNVFAWDFFTGSTTPPLTCAGYTSAAQCLSATNCPNSPGQCQTSSVGEVGNCGDAYCNANYSQCAGVCTYASSTNFCTTNIACNDVFDGSGAQGMVFNGASINDFMKTSSSTQPDPTAIEMEGSNSVYAFVGKNHWGASTEYIPVDTSRTYLISARFKALGAGPSITYLGYVPYDANKKEIRSIDVIRYGSMETITAFDATTISAAEAISGWNVGGVAQAHTRSLGFYYNGDTTKIPDYVYWWFPLPFPPYGNSAYNPLATQGAYSTAAANTINLNTPLPAAVTGNIILGTTKVMDHGFGGTYLYSGASGVSLNVADGWREMSGNIIDEAFGNNPANFRPGTKFVKIIYGVNHDGTVAQTGPSANKVWVDDLSFYPASCNKVNGIAVFQVDTNGASCPASSFRDTNNKCTLGTLGNPKTCSLCPFGLTCSNGKCAVERDVCPGSSTCNEVSGKCEDSSATCECCCRVSNSAQDCCPGLTCVAGGCGNDPLVYGQCQGCRVEIDGFTGSTTPQEQAFSDQACNCQGGSTRRCDFVVANAADIGTCVDTSTVGGACDDESPDNPAVCVDPQDWNCAPGQYCVPAGLPNECTCQATTTPAVLPCDGDTSTAACMPGDADDTMCAASPATPVCDPTSCTCVSNAGAGDLCLDMPVCTTGVAACAPDYSCLQDGGAGGDCRCCCTPGSTNAAGLKCVEDIAPCSTAARGLFCGCTADAECGNPLIDACGNDTCCRTRPTVASTSPMNNEVAVCRNPLISVKFDQPMDPNSFSGNVILVGDYGASLCPANTTFLTSVPRQGGLFVRAWNKIKTFFGGTATAIVGNFCAVVGTTAGYNDQVSGNGVLTFSPQALLDPARDYYVVIEGDASSTDSTRDGVLSSFGIAMDGTTATSTIGLNAINYHGYNWKFTTKPSTAADNGVCKFDKVVLDPSGYVFTRAAATTTIVAYPETNTGAKIVPIASVYDWSWTWLSEDTTVVTVSNTNNPVQLVTAGNKKDARTYVDVQARITNDNIMKPSTKNQTRTAKALMRLFICANPWPPIANVTTWPWQDADDNCSAGLSGAGCENYNFEFYYCRDGQKGSAPALPSIQNTSSTPIRGSYNNILKEYFFLRAGTPVVMGGLTTTTPATGGQIILTWLTAGLDGYKVYYGTQPGKYDNYIDVGPTGNALITNLTNGKKYYFTVKGYSNATGGNATGAESEYWGEVWGIPTDTVAPAMPRGMKVTSNNDTISWVANTDDTVKYKVYLGTTLGVYGQAFEVGKSTQATLSGLRSDQQYFVTVTAIDASGNESAKTFADSGGNTRDYKIVIHKNIQVLKDLKAINDALEAYRTANGSYPNSTAGNGSFDGYCSNWGDDFGVNWIPALAAIPYFPGGLPFDPGTPAGYVCDGIATSTNPNYPQYLQESKQYYYRSNGTDYKLISHSPEDMVSIDQALIDPSRKTWAFGYWSTGGASF